MNVRECDRWIRNNAMKKEKELHNGSAKASILRRTRANALFVTNITLNALSYMAKFTRCFHLSDIIFFHQNKHKHTHRALVERDASLGFIVDFFSFATENVDLSRCYCDDKLHYSAIIRHPEIENNTHKMIHPIWIKNTSSCDVLGRSHSGKNSSQFASSTRLNSKFAHKLYTQQTENRHL